MEDETQVPPVTDSQVTETPPGTEPETPPQVPETVPSETDEQGVEWKNRAEEYRRKYEEALERQAAQQSQPAAQPKVADEFENIAPDTKKLLDTYYQRMRHQEKLKDAYDYLREKNISVKEVDAIAAEYGLSNVDPMRLVKAAERIKIATTPKKTPAVVSTEREVARTNKIKSTTTEVGSRPAAPKPKESDALYQKFKESGAVKDYEVYTRKKLEEK